MNQACERIEETALIHRYDAMSVLKSRHSAAEAECTKMRKHLSGAKAMLAERKSALDALDSDLPASFLESARTFYDEIESAVSVFESDADFIENRMKGLD